MENLLDELVLVFVFFALLFVFYRHWSCGGSYLLSREKEKTPHPIEAI